MKTRRLQVDASGCMQWFLLVLLVCLHHGMAQADGSQTVTDLGEVKEFVDRLNAGRHLPDNYRIVFRVERIEAGVRNWRIDEIVKKGENNYWRMEYQGRPQDPARRRELLVMPDSAGQATAWETDQAPHPTKSADRGEGLFDTPMRPVRFHAETATDARLDIGQDTALLSYTEKRPDGGGDIDHHYAFDLHWNFLKEARNSHHAPAAVEEHRWLETFDTNPALADDYFEQIRTRLQETGRKARQKSATMEIADLVALFAGALWPIWVAFGKYRRSLSPSTRGKLIAGAMAFLAGIPALATLAMIKTSGYLGMMVIAVPWAVVGDRLPREIALPASQFLGAAMFSAFASLLILRILEWTVIRRQTAGKE
jgi:hypothetical protein